MAEVTSLQEVDIDSTPNNNVPTEDDQDSVDITINEAGFSAFCQAPYNEVYSAGFPAGQNDNIFAIHAPTGALVELTTSNLSSNINTLATDHVNNLVYYAEGQSLFAWNVLSDTHFVITNNISSVPGGSSIVSLTSGGAAFYNGALYLGVETLQGNSDFEVFRVNFDPASNGQTIQSITALDINGPTNANGVLSNGDWGDAIISDGGILFGVTRNGGGGANSTFWSFDLNSNSNFTIINPAVTLGLQLAKDGNGTVYGLRDDQVIGELNLLDGSLSSIQSTAPHGSADAGECVIGESSIGDRVWEDINGDGVQDAGEPGIENVTVDLYRDINSDGVIDAGDPLLGTLTTDVNGNYDFTDLIFGDYIVDVSDNNNVLTDFTLTGGTDPLPVNLPSGTITDFDDADFGYQENDPNLLLVKRITAINGGTTSNSGDDLSIFNDDPGTTDDNDSNWPNDDDTFLPGGLNGGVVEPGDEVEFTVYFLNNGSDNASNIVLCDLVPENMSFVEDSFGVGIGIALALDSGSLPTAPTSFFTNVGGDDQGEFIAAGNPAPAACNQTDFTVPLAAVDNTSGAVVINIPNISNATGAGTPNDSYGFIRFRVRFDN